MEDSFVRSSTQYRSSQIPTPFLNPPRLGGNLLFRFTSLTMGYPLVTSGTQLNMKARKLMLESIHLLVHAVHNAVVRLDFSEPLVVNV